MQHHTLCELVSFIGMGFRVRVVESSTLPQGAELIMCKPRNTQIEVWRSMVLDVVGKDVFPVRLGSVLLHGQPAFCYMDGDANISVLAALALHGYNNFFATPQKP